MKSKFEQKSWLNFGLEALLKLAVDVAFIKIFMRNQTKTRLDLQNFVVQAN